MSRLLQRVPAQYVDDVEVWIAALRGSGRRPSQPLEWVSIRNYLNFALPVLIDWAPRLTSLREVTRSDIELALADHTGSSTHNVHTALRSLFRGLRREKRVFADPARGVVGHYARKLPRPLPSDRLRGLLGQLADPRERLIVALVAVHAVGITEIRNLRIEHFDRSAGILTVERRHHTHRLVLEELMMTLIRDWLTARSARWPTTRNPYLFISSQTAVGTGPMSPYGLGTSFRRLGIAASRLRADRILDEATHSSDPVALIRVFGLGVTTAVRYVRAAHPGRFDLDPTSP
ncbi:site-specific integrase [Prescottella equi]|uniref:site-specific integrase n=1 Tax=Rhodococcus hoagii TaxID=43767 RepID=UPI00111BEC84|nr:hypothetical protein [Prescottella equi]